MQHGLDQHMLQDDAFAWQALAAHFGSDRANVVASSRRRFAAHLRPDLQAAIIAALTPLSPSLHGVHQGHEFAPLTISQLAIRGERDAVAITPLQYQDIAIGETEPFAALATGLWLFSIEKTPGAVLGRRIVGMGA